MEDDPELFYYLPDQELLDYVEYKRLGRTKFSIPEESLCFPYLYEPTCFDAEPGYVYSPFKKRSKGEKECKRVLEKFFDEPFYTFRPEFIMDKRPLELDLFNSKLGIACEFHGKQHYVYPNRFIKKKDKFIAQLRRDLYKMHTCKNLGILFIVVPYSCVDIEEFLIEKLSLLSLNGVSEEEE